MTPLAHQIVADSTLPIAKRRFGNASERLRLLDGVHFFDCTDVLEMALDLACTLDADRISGANFVFLPADRTWIEFSCRDVERIDSDGRWAVLLEKNGSVFDVSRVYLDETGIGISTRFATIHATGSDRLGEVDFIRSKINGQDGIDELGRLANIIIALLSFINTPRIIGRRTHLPHAGLQRKLATARGMVGKFPLQAWTEIVLEVTPPKVDDGEPHETRLTGAKARHFVRCHLRIRLGRLELVSPHWRGDAALGIKQSRYRMTPPRSGRAA
jgi:hypothetical protein